MMREHPPVNPTSSAIRGGHWRPASALTSTKVVVYRDPHRRKGIVDTTPPKATKQHISAEMRNLRPKRERGIRGLVRRWMGWH